MRKFRAWLFRFSNFLIRHRRERDLADEVEANLQLHIDDNLRSGMELGEAQRAARVKLGGIDALKEAVRDRRGVPFLEMLARDVSYALRMMWQDKGWSAVAISSLSLGIGVNTALFSIANGVLLQKLPVPHPDQLVAFRWVGENYMTNGLSTYGYTPPDPQTGRSGEHYSGASFSYGVFRQFQKESMQSADVFAFFPLSNLNVIANGQAEMATGQFVSGNFYGALGVSPLLGRTINSSDDGPAADSVIVISYQYWQRRFAMDKAVIGRTVTINKMPFTIIGVTPDTFGSTTRIGGPPPDVALPLALEPRLLKASGTASRLEAPARWSIIVMARLKQGGATEQLEAKLQPIFQATAREEWMRALSTMNPERRALPEVSQANKLPRLQIVDGSRGAFEALPQQTSSLVILGTIAAVVLLVVCTNLANLLLSRASARQREIAIRTAIGATRTRMVGQMLTESLVIAAFGGLFGSLAAYFTRTMLPLWLGFRAPDMDWRVTSFAVGLTFATGILFGLFPALRATRVDITRRLPQTGLRLARGRSGLGKCLLIVQVALSLILMIAAGLFLRTLNNLRNVDVGFNPTNIVLFRIVPALNQYDTARATALYERILERLSAVPGIRSVTMSSIPMLSAMSNRAPFSIDGAPPYAERHALEVHYNYFDTMEIPIKLGRSFTPQDNLAAPAVTVINEAFAKEFFPNENPIGHRLQQTFPGAPVTQIIGVVGDAKYVSLRDKPPATFYIHDLQRPTGVKTFAVRTAGDAAAFIPAIRERMRQIDPLLPLQLVSTQSENIERSMLQERVFALTTSLFGGLALVVSMIGLFGLVSYTVERRRKEIGIRMAIGAERSQIRRAVLRETLILVAIGIVAGLATALACTRWIASSLYGLPPHDVPTLVMAIALMLAAAALAAYLPARRASQVDPLTALRYE